MHGYVRHVQISIGFLNVFPTRTRRVCYNKLVTVAADDVCTQYAAAGTMRADMPRRASMIGSPAFLDVCLYAMVLRRLRSSVSFCVACVLQNPLTNARFVHGFPDADVPAHTATDADDDE